MKNLIFFLTAWCMVAACSDAPAQVFSNDDLVITSLGDRMWVVETTDKTTMYLVEGDEKALLIDTGTKCKKLDEVIRQVTQKPLLVVLTHTHYDHAGNIGYFDDIYLHPADTVLMDHTYKGKMHFVGDGYVFDLGNRPVRVIHMPAHTPGSIVLADLQTGSCFSGDAFGSGHVWLQLKPTAPMQTYISSLNKMTALMDQGITKIYCGHYPHVKKILGKDYILAMMELALSLDNGTASGAKPFNIKVTIGCENPMIVSNGPASIVYDPDHLK
jgi:glyoxylase-like metal-dependent hydrolase (beta-lactamase superfamily II)